MGINNRILCQGRHHSGAYAQGLFWAQRTGLRGFLIYRGRAQGSQGSGVAPRSWLCARYAFSAHSLCFIIVRLLVRTHSSEMTTSGNNVDSIKRGVRRRGKLRGVGGAPAGEAAEAAQLGRRSAADSREAWTLHVW